MHPFFHISIHTQIHRSVHPSVHSFILSSVHASIQTPIHPTTHPFHPQSTYQHANLSIQPNPYVTTSPVNGMLPTYSSMILFCSMYRPTSNSFLFFRLSRYFTIRYILEPWPPFTISLPHHVTGPLYDNRTRHDLTGSSDYVGRSVCVIVLIRGFMS